ncbi:unnamed protein product, partial [Closterium sp. Naga37s-1]
SPIIPFNFFPFPHSPLSPFPSSPLPLLLPSPRTPSPIPPIPSSSLLRPFPSSPFSPHPFSHFPQGDSRKDLLAVMLAARDDVSNEQMTDQQLVDECVTFLLAGTVRYCAVQCGAGRRYEVLCGAGGNECSAEASATQAMLPCSPTPPIVSGHETTAKLLTWAVYLLARYPEWQERVREEVWRVMGREEIPEGGGGGGGANREGGGKKLGVGGEKGEGGGEGEKEEGGGEAGKGNGRRGGGREVTWEQLSQLSEMHMVLLETLRLFPPTPVITREAVKVRPFQASKVRPFQASKHVSLGPYSLPAGTRITMAIGMAQSDPRFWGEDALEFNPARFQDGIQGACSHPQAFLPFSAGPRRCIGSTFEAPQKHPALPLLPMTPHRWDTGSMLTPTGVSAILSGPSRLHRLKLCSLGGQGGSCTHAESPRVGALTHLCTLADYGDRT